MDIYINNCSLQIKNITQIHFDSLIHYWNSLSKKTKSKFAPHHFDTATIENLFAATNNNYGYIIEHTDTKSIIAYAIVVKGCLSYEANRLQNYGLTLMPHTDCTFAPSVVDKWQGKGLGKHLFDFISSHLKSKTSFNRMFLWGGVQANNTAAISFYKKNNFIELGFFEYNGQNVDMMLLL